MPSNFASLCYRKLVKNLWMGYFHASDQKKSEVVQLMGKILGFSQEELDQVCCELPPESTHPVVLLYRQPRSQGLHC